VSNGVVGVVAGKNGTFALLSDEAVSPAEESYRRWNAGDEEAR
jgi:hypothetical protein